VVVAVIPVGVVQVVTDQVVRVITVRNRLVPATRPVLVARLMAAALVIRSALVGMRRIHGDRMLVDVVPVRVMKVPIVQVVDVPVVLERGMAAVRPVSMIVPFVNPVRFHLDLLRRRYLPASLLFTRCCVDFHPRGDK
jgi:hypothetical protein